MYDPISFAASLSLVSVVQALNDLKEEPRAALSQVQDLLQRVARG